MLFDAVLANLKAQGPAGEGPGKVHPLAQRYASLAASLLTLNAEHQVHSHNALRCSPVRALGPACPCSSCMSCCIQLAEVLAYA